jgi:DNA-directed RNA polymerase specialized sigma24 family protein
MEAEFEDATTFSPHMVARALRTVGMEAADEDLYDLRLDIERLLPRLPQSERHLLDLYAQGWSPQDAAVQLELSGNAQKMYNQAIRRLTALINGGGEG